MAEPCCAKCGSENINSKKKFILGVEGRYIYCVDCGAIIVWIPEDS